jgi:hypothetical protein
MGKQTFVIHLEEELARRITTLLTSKDTGYGSFDELTAVALINQLGLESADANGAAARPEAARSEPSSAKPQYIQLGMGDVLLNVLARPSSEPQLPLASEPATSNERLFLLTNRLSPIKIAVRVLANLSLRGSWPDMYSFQNSAAHYAREVGLRLSAEDRTSQRQREHKRGTGYPVGENADRSAGRFILAFTIDGTPSLPTGPLAILGLANLVDRNRVALTAVGWQLAVAPSPLLNEAPGALLSEEEQRLLRVRVASAPGECAAVSEFLHLVRRAAGLQGKLDELLALEHRDWSANLRTANRAALVGRLADLGILASTGKGPTARIELFGPAREFTESALRVLTS